MRQAKWSRVLAALCLLALMTIAAQCSEEPSIADYIAADSAADTAIALERTIYPEVTATATQTPEPEPTEVVITDELNDVQSLITGEPATGWGPGLDIGEVSMGVDPDTGNLVYRVSTPGIEDPEAFIAANPNWALIIAGDGDPEGTPALPGLDMYGMGQWHIGCFTNTGQILCQLWIREGNQFTEGGEAFGGFFVDGMWTIHSPDGYPRQGDRIGFAVVDPFYFDTLGLEDWTPTLQHGPLRIEY